MTETTANAQGDLLNLLEYFGPNRDVDGGSKTIKGIRLILEGSGMVVPTLEEVRSLTGGKIAEIVAVHQAPLKITRETKELAEWRRQTDRFIGLGFADELKFSDPEKYRLTVPKFFRQPRNWRGIYDYPTAVEGRIPHSRICKLADITQYVDTSQITDEANNLPPVYTIYVAGTSRLVVGTFAEAIPETPKNGVAGLMVEVDMTYLNHPQLFDDEHGRWRDAGRSRCGAGSIPCLEVWDGSPVVDAGRAGYPSRSWRVLFRGNKIGTLNLGNFKLLAA